MLLIRRLALTALASACALASCAFVAAPDVSHGSTAPAAQDPVPLAAGTGGWRVAAHIAMPGRAAYLQSVAAASADDVWSAGASAGPRGTASRLLIERWSDHRWQPVAVPGPLAAKFQAGEPGRQTFALVQASSAGHAWFFNQETGAFLRWDGVTRPA
jgi:hypothetical protein